MVSRRPPAAGAGGFTYVGLLFAIALVGLMLATVGVVWSTQSRREREQELLFAGAQIRDAIGRYVRDPQGGARGFPQSLEDLLEDKRGSSVQHYLRRLYRDPITGSTDWELLRAPDGGIMGVASKSTAEPLKKANFPEEFADFSDAASYADWQFVYRPRALFRGGVRTPASAPSTRP